MYRDTGLQVLNRQADLFITFSFVCIKEHCCGQRNASRQRTYPSIHQDVCVYVVCACSCVS